MPSEDDFDMAEKISIHALRVEGDKCPGRNPPSCDYFYPRPPCGGRRLNADGEITTGKFLSTPSVWRATLVYDKRIKKTTVFLSTPSVWRATCIPCNFRGQHF